MKGIDLTPEQIEAARHFEQSNRRTTQDVSDETRVAFKYGDIVRLIAWYGAIRYQSGKEGVGTLEKPAPLVNR